MKQRVIVITGGASGIGKETAFKLAEENVKLVIADLNLDAARKVAQTLEKDGHQARAFKMDVSKEEDFQKVLEFTVSEFGTITGIFNNAGIGIQKPLLDMDYDTYKKVIEIDQDSIYFGTRLTAKKMIELGVENGVIVNTASIYGYMAAQQSYNYHAAKAAVVMMTKAGAIELAEHNIRVVAVAPGFVDTPILEALDEEVKAHIASQHMRKKLIDPKEIANVVRFLFSEEASAINGSTIAVDDGFLAFKQ